MSETGRVRVGLGIPSLLVMVTAMALTVLGVLTFNAAQADAALQQRHEALSAAYYGAAVKAQEALLDLDEAMAQAYGLSESEADYARRCMEIPCAGDAQLTWTDETNAVLEISAGYNRQIRMDIRRCAFAQAGAARFTLIRQVLEDTSEWGEAPAIPLIAGAPNVHPDARSVS